MKFKKINSKCFEFELLNLAAYYIYLNLKK